MQTFTEFQDEVVVDNFAGGGGASTGIERALNRPIDYAVNHDRFALGMHKVNHPRTVHRCEDIFATEPRLMVEGRPVGFGWFSPDCTHFSKAKGGKPLKKEIRGLALVMLRWARIGTRVMAMENVGEIVTWGPLLQDATHRKGCDCLKPCGKPDPRYKGRTWLAFKAALGPGLGAQHPDIPEMLELLRGTISKEELVRGFGYQMEHREIRACDVGTPTIRKRLVMIARRDGKAIVWPAATHCKPELVSATGLKPYRAIAECIDFSRPCPSIFLTKKQAKAARCRRPLAAASERRIACGVDRYVLKAARPFIVRRELTTDSADNTDFSQNETKGGLFLTEYANGSTQRNFAGDEPMRTLCAQVKGGHFAAVVPVMVHKGHYSSNSGMVKGADERMRCQATREEHGVVAVHLTKFSTGAVGQDARDPIKTITAGTHSPETHGGAATVHGMVGCSLVRQFGASIGQAVDVPGPTVMPKGQGKTGLLAATMVCLTHQGTERVEAVDEPTPTITGANRGERALVAASLIKMRGDPATHAPGSGAEEPMGTVSAGGAHHAVSFATLTKYYGNDTDGCRVDEAAHTVTSRERFGLNEVRAAIGLTEEQLAGARRVAKFLRKYGVVFEGEFAMVGDFVVVDIGMRMLMARELFLAQGFPSDYVIDRALVVDPATGEEMEIKLTKEQQIRMCGNSVCPDLAEAITRCNVPELVWEMAVAA